MITEEINKAAEKYTESLKSIAFESLSGEEMPYLLRGAFKEGLESANKYWQEKTRWIPVEERLPQIQANGFSDMVLTRDKHGIIKIERYDQEFGNFSGLRYGGAVTHWKEIE